jgi:hypothetical protein
VDLETALARYADALSCLKIGESQPSAPDILSILVARDAVQQALEDRDRLSQESLSKLLELNDFLRKQADAIAKASKLKEWRKTFNPPEEAWWVKSLVGLLDCCCWVLSESIACSRISQNPMQIQQKIITIAVY